MLLMFFRKLLQEKIRVYTDVIYAHRDFANKTCPGSKFDMNRLKSKVAELFLSRGFNVGKDKRIPLLNEKPSRMWSGIVVHHSATKDQKVPDWEAIWKYHIVVKGWKAIGYNFGIEKINGIWTYRSGRSLAIDGGHTKEKDQNKKSVGIVLIGNYDVCEPPEIGYDMVARLCWELFCTKVVVPG